MDSKILNLFKFLSSKEDRHLSKKTLDILICKHGFNPDNKDIVNYLKSLGGNDELFNDVKKWMDEMFKNLNKYVNDDYPKVTLYGNTIFDILIEEDLKNDRNYIHHDKVYSVFKSKYKGYISEYQDIMSIFQEYLGSTLQLKGSRTQWNNYHQHI